MLLIDHQDLEARGITCQGVSEFIFLDKCFLKGQTFDAEQRESAIISCRKMLDDGLMSFIINYQSHFTIWVESDAVSNQELLQVSPEGAKDKDESSKASTSSSNYQQLLTKLNEPISLKSLFSRRSDPDS